MHTVVSYVVVGEPVAAFQILVVGVGTDAGLRHLDIVHNSQHT